jgi:hypothetical protein
MLETAMLVLIVVGWIDWLVSVHTRDHEARHWLFWLPLRDMLTTLVWVFGLFGERVMWRAETYLVDREGHIRALVPAGRPSLGMGPSPNR